MEAVRRCNIARKFVCYRYVECFNMYAYFCSFFDSLLKSNLKRVFFCPKGRVLWINEKVLNVSIFMRISFPFLKDVPLQLHTLYCTFLFVDLLCNLCSFS